MNLFIVLLTVNTVITTLHIFWYSYWYFFKRKMLVDSKHIVLISWLFVCFCCSIISSISYYIDSSSLIFYIIFQTLMFSVIPTFNFVFKPIFYALLHKGERDDGLENVFKRHGGSSVKVFISKISNAFAMGVTGYGKVIIIGRDLKENLGEDDLKSILFHELGHHKYHHLLKIYFYTLIISFLAAILSVLSEYFFEEYVYEVVLVGLNGFLYGLLMYYSLAFQKRMEYQADLYAVSVVGSKSYENALIRLNEYKNGRLEKKSITHPTLSQRIKNIHENN